MNERLESKLDSLEKQGVSLLDRRQVYLSDDVQVGRICRAAVLYPGTRLVGAQTFIGPGAKIGTEGPATIENTVIGQDAEVAGGYVSGTVLLCKAKVGSGAHIRPGTLFEEEASSAHAVGLKQTILMSFVTMGSLINFCDALISGGTSRRDHTEVGSGFIHFNFTPRGQSGDKATPSLVGDVPHGAFLRQPRIFLGGLSAMVGPQKVGFGSLTVAGQVIRNEVPPNRMVGDAPRRFDKDIGSLSVTPDRILRLNANYIGQLIALQAWYRQVRLARIPVGREYEHIRIVTQAAMDLLDVCIDERVQRLDQFTKERELTLPAFSFETSDVPPCPLHIEPAAPYTEHTAWVAQLSEADVQQGVSWLHSIVAQTEQMNPAYQRAG